MNRFVVSLATALLVALGAGPVRAQTVQDFQLPPAPSPTQDARAQGPVDTDAPVPVRPRVIATDRARAAPTPTIVLPTPARTAPTSDAPTPTAQRTRTTPAPSARAVAVSPSEGAARPVVAAPVPTIDTPATAPPAIAPSGIASSAAASAPISASPSSELEVSSEDLGDGRLAWVLGAAVAFGLLGLALFFWRRRRSQASAEPAIVTPYAPPASASAGEVLALAVEAMRLDRSLMAATVGYRVTVRNRTSAALSGIVVEADLVSASGERTPEQQLASPDQPLTQRHAAGRLAPGQSLRFEGQVRLPLAEANAIWQGRVSLLVPLLRVRALADGTQPVATTLVIGRAEGAAARPQPFRFDEPPRSYAPLAQRVVGVAA